MPHVQTGSCALEQRSRCGACDMHSLAAQGTLACQVRSAPQGVACEPGSVMSSRPAHSSGSTLKAQLQFSAAEASCSLQHATAGRSWPPGDDFSSTWHKLACAPAVRDRRRAAAMSGVSSMGSSAKRTSSVRGTRYLRSTVCGWHQALVLGSRGAHGYVVSACPAECRHSSWQASYAHDGFAIKADGHLSAIRLRLSVGTGVNSTTPLPTCMHTQLQEVGYWRADISGSSMQGRA